MSYEASLNTLSSTPVSQMHMVCASEAEQTQYGYRCQAHVFYESAYLGNVWLSSSEAYNVFDEITCVGRFKPLDDSDFGHSLRMQGYLGTIEVIHLNQSAQTQGLTAAIQRLRTSLLNTFTDSDNNAASANEDALLKGMILGSKRDLKEHDINSYFTSAGLAHLIAVSGAHLAIISSLIVAVLKKLKLKPHVRFLLLLAVTLFYVVLIGAPPSAIRAWVMNMVAFGSVLLLRRPYALASVSCAAFVLFLSNPFSCYQLGAVLSVVCVLALCLFEPLCTYYITLLNPLRRYMQHKATPGFVKNILYATQQVLSASMVCAVASFPLVAEAFGQISLMGPLSAVLVTPLFAPLMITGICSLIFSWVPYIGTFMLGLARLIARLMLLLVIQLAAVPGAVVPLTLNSGMSILMIIVVFSALLLVWPLPSRKNMLRLIASAAVVLMGFMLVGKWVGPARMVVLNVGQGDAILLQGQGRALLVDTGPDDSVIHRLRECGVYNLDGVLITHQHDDHYGGLSSVEHAYALANIFLAQGVKDHLCDELKQDLSVVPAREIDLIQGDAFEVGPWRCRVVWPDTTVDGTHNADSLCLVAELCNSNFKILLTGDAEQDELAHFTHEVGRIDVLKVGHHGSAISLNEEEVHVLKPLIAVASAGKNNRYGHPKEACLEILQSVGAYFLCTKDVGTVDIRPTTRGSAEIRCYGLQASFG